MEKEKCEECGNPFKFIPSLKERGITWAEAKATIVDVRGGCCSECYLMRLRREAYALMKRKCREDRREVTLTKVAPKRSTAK